MCIHIYIYIYIYISSRVVRATTAIVYRDPRELGEKESIQLAPGAKGADGKAGTNSRGGVSQVIR